MPFSSLHFYQMSWTLPFLPSFVTLLLSPSPSPFYLPLLPPSISLPSSSSSLLHPRLPTPRPRTHELFTQTHSHLMSTYQYFNFGKNVERPARRECKWGCVHWLPDVKSYRGEFSFDFNVSNFGYLSRNLNAWQYRSFTELRVSFAFIWSVCGLQYGTFFVILSTQKDHCCIYVPVMMSLMMIWSQCIVRYYSYIEIR